MSAPTRRPVRLRRSPKVGVFLTLGVLVGVVVAVLIALLTPANDQYPTTQVLGFLVLLCAPVGAALGGLVAVVLDAVGSRRARVIEAERIEGPAASPAIAESEALRQQPDAEGLGAGAGADGLHAGEDDAAGQSGEGLPGGVHP